MNVKERPSLLDGVLRARREAEEKKERDRRIDTTIASFEEEQRLKQAAVALNITPIPYGAHSMHPDTGEIEIEQTEEELEAEFLKIKNKLKAAKRAKKARSIPTEVVTTRVPKPILVALHEEFVPLMRSLLPNPRADFSIGEAFRHLLYFGVKYPNRLKGVTFEDVMEGSNDDDKQGGW